MGSSKYLVWINPRVRTWIRGKSLIPETDSFANYQHAIEIVWEVADSLSAAIPIEGVLTKIAAKYEVAFCHNTKDHGWTGLIVKIDNEDELFRCVIIEDRSQIHIQEIIDV